MSISLWQLLEKEKAEVLGPADKLCQRTRQRLIDLGLKNGAMVMCEQVIPFGGPKVFQIGKCLFSLEKHLAEEVLVEKLQ